MKGNLGHRASHSLRVACDAALNRFARMPYSKLLILGLDSLNWKMLRPLLADGVMPNVKRLVDEGCHGVLESTLPPTTPPAWTSFMTGVHPGTHGIIGFKSFDPQTNEYKLLDTKNLGPRSFYTRLSAAGKRVGVGMQPNTHPPFELNGFVITGFDSPGTRSDFAYPKELEAEIQEICPEHQGNYDLKKGWEEDQGDDDEALARNIERLNVSIRRQADLYAELMRRKDPEIFMAYFQAPDVLFHHAWGWCDPETAGSSPARRNLVEGFFGELDVACGRLLEIWPDEGRLTLALSDHGHQSRAINCNMNSILGELGFLHPSGTLTRLRETLAGAGKKSQDRGMGVRIDWRRTEAFMPIGEQSAFIYVNLEGRQPYGSVPKDRYEEVRDRVIAALREYRRPDTGEKAFEEVHCGDECFERKDEYLLPDIVVNPPANVQFKRKLRSGPSFSARKDPFTGNHHPDGIYVWHGGGVRVGEGARAHLVDLAPTILALFGADVPSYMSGKMQSSCFLEPPSPRIQPMEWGEATEPGAAYSAEEEALIEQRLEDLGYVD